LAIPPRWRAARGGVGRDRSCLFYSEGEVGVAFPKDFKDLLQIFDQNGVEFLLVGGTPRALGRAARNQSPSSTAGAISRRFPRRQGQTSFRSASNPNRFDPEDGRRELRGGLEGPCAGDDRRRPSGKFDYSRTPAPEGVCQTSRLGRCEGDRRGQRG